MPSSKISVIIPLYNKAAHIERAIRSVLAQSHQDFELLVVDDGSTDGGGEVARRLGDPRLRVIPQQNAGVSAARNRGIREARHDFIAFLDADDEYNPRLLEVLLGLTVKHPSAGAYGASWQVINESGRTNIQGPRVVRGGRVEDALIRGYFRAVLESPVLWTSTTAIPKSTFEAVGLFPEGVPTGEDVDLWMRIGARFPIAVASYVGAVYHREASNRTDDGRYHGIEYELVNTGKRLLASADLSRRERRSLTEYVARYEMQTAMYLILLGQKARAREILRGCRTRSAFLKKLWWLVWTFIPTPVATAAERLVKTLRPSISARPEATT